MKRPLLTKPIAARALAIAMSVMSAATVSAQDAAIAPAPASAPPPATADSDATTGERTDALDAPPTGSAHGERDGTAPDATSPTREPVLPALLDDSTFMLSLGFFGGAVQESGFDRALTNFGYAEAPRAWGGELDAEWRAIGFLWIGGRAELRSRQWARTSHEPASALGLSALVLADARANLGRRIDVGLSVGAGFGAMMLTVNGVTETVGLPRLYAAVKFGWTVFEPLRMFVRVSVDYSESLAVNSSDHTVNMGIVSIGLGVEARQ